MILRILASITLLFSILFLPFYFSVILAILGMAYFPLFLEAIFLFLLSDLLYGARESRLWHMTFISLFISIFILIIIEFLKRKMKFHF
jgi:ABC-type uncharacterized transport system permease subunit